jgi:hypothetical protein
MRISFALTLALLTLTLAGCSKAPPPKSPTVDGVTVDTPKLMQAFQPNPSREIQDTLMQISMGIRYSDYMKALAALDQLNSNPSLTPDQKKVVGTVIEQIKQVMSKPPAPKTG